jgi:ABC-type antimicrobial peptide transport system permease subunit
MLAKIQQDYANTEKNINNRNYQEPSLQFQAPTVACGDITVKKDTRTQSEKEEQANTETTQKKLGLYVPPKHYLTTFQIVGIVNAQPFSEYNVNIESYITNLLSPQDTSFSAIIPLQLYEQLPGNLKFNTQITSQTDSTRYTLENTTFASRVLEFASIDKARSFLSSETCPSHDLGCTKSFYGIPYGSNYLILDEIGKLFRHILSIALPILIGMALIIVWFTISRIMSENRKETAVYRAMGAKRIDIATIYIIYTLLLAARISALSFVFGISIAYAIDRIYGAQLTDVALSTFGIITDNLRFSLFDLSSPLLLGILGIIFATSIIACIQPLIRNVLRPPIRDMREE